LAYGDIITYTAPPRPGTPGTDLSWRFFSPTISQAAIPVMSKYGDSTIGTILRVTIRSYITGTNIEDVDAQVRRARGALTEPQGTFQWVFDGGDGTSTNVMVLTPQDCVEWGPRILDTKFVSRWGGRAVEIIWTLEAFVGPSFGWSFKNPNGAIALELMYTVSTSIDRNCYSQRQIAGSLRVMAGRTDQFVGVGGAAPFRGADMLRNTVEAYICGIPNGWQRVSRSYQQSEDGLVLSFYVVDEQRRFALPPDCTSGDVSIETSVSPPVSGRVLMTLKGYFEGHPNSNYGPRAALADLVNKLWQGKATPTFSVILQDLNLSQSLYRNSISFSMSWLTWTPAIDEASNSQDMSIAMANFAMMLTTQANTWLNGFANGITTNTGPYGNTTISGWCGSGEPLGAVPVFKYMPGGIPGANNQENAGSDNIPTNPTEDTGPQNYSYWRQSFFYVADPGNTVVPTMGQVATIVQQIRNPVVFLVCIGEAERMNQKPMIPLPPLDPSKGKLVAPLSFTVESPRGGPIYRAQWQYTQVATGMVQSGGSDVPMVDPIAAILPNLYLPWTPDQANLFPNFTQGRPNPGQAWPGIETPAGLFADGSY